MGKKTELIRKYTVDSLYSRLKLAFLLQYGPRPGLRRLVYVECTYLSDSHDYLLVASQWQKYHIIHGPLLPVKHVSVVKQMEKRRGVRSVSLHVQSQEQQLF